MISLTDTAARHQLADPLAGLPLIPTRRPAAALTGVPVEGRSVTFEEIDWSIQEEGEATPGISHESVEKAYLALLRRLSPGQALIRIPLSDLVTSPGAGARRTGSQYRQMRAALEYLTRVRLGPAGMRVVTCWSEHAPGSTPGGRTGGTIVEVEIAPEFVARLGDPSATRLDRRLLTQLRPGLEQGLYRLVCRLRSEGTLRVSALEAFQRLGSLQTDVRPARVRQMLGKVHASLVRLGVLAKLPEPIVEDGTTYLEYSATEVIEGMEAEVLLKEIAQAYGVSRHGVLTLVTDHLDGLERTIAAAALGILIPERTLPGMIVHYARTGEIIPDKGRRYLPETASQVAAVAEGGEAAYLAGAARECIRRAAGDPRLYADGLPRLARQWAERRVARGHVHEPWVSEGLALASLQRMLDLPTLDESRERSGR